MFMVFMNLLKLSILFLFQELRDLPSLWVCVSVYVCAHIWATVSSLYSIFHTMTVHSNPIKETQRASQHPSFICHSFSPSISLTHSLSLSLLPVDNLVVTGWVSSNYHFLLLSLSFALYFLS